MKKISILAGILVCSFSVFSQTIYIANSSAGAVTGVNTFTGNNAINLAIAAAAANGDIIYVVPNGVGYLPPTLGGKGVSIIGAGFNPDKPGGAHSILAGISANANIIPPGTVTQGTSVLSICFQIGTQPFFATKLPDLVGANNGFELPTNSLTGSNFGTKKKFVAHGIQPVKEST